MPQYGQYTSLVLGLALMIVDEKLRFYHADAALPEVDEVIARLGSALDGLIERQQELELGLKEERRAREEAEQKSAEERRSREEAEREREEAKRQLAEALAELERIKGGR